MARVCEASQCLAQLDAAPLKFSMGSPALEEDECRQLEVRKRTSSCSTCASLDDASMASQFSLASGFSDDLEWEDGFERGDEAETGNIDDDRHQREHASPISNAALVLAWHVDQGVVECVVERPVIPRMGGLRCSLRCSDLVRLGREAVVQQDGTSNGGLQRVPRCSDMLEHAMLSSGAAPMPAWCAGQGIAECVVERPPMPRTEGLRRSSRCSDLVRLEREALVRQAGPSARGLHRTPRCFDLLEMESWVPTLEAMDAPAEALGRQDFF